MTTTDSAREQYTAWCHDQLFTEELIQATALMQEALDWHLLDIYSRLGLGEKLTSQTTPD